MEDLLKKIQLLNCSGECLQNEIKINEALLDQQPIVYKLLTQNLATIAAQGGRRKRRVRKRKRNTRVIVFGGHDNEDVWELDSSMQFVKLSKLPQCPYLAHRMSNTRWFCCYRWPRKCHLQHVCLSYQLLGTA